MKTLLIVSLLATGCAQLSEKPMTVAERIRYNSAPWSPECVFDKTGKATNNNAGLFGCSDYRSTPLLRQDYARALLEAKGEPTAYTVIQFSRVSEVEVVCYAITGLYVRACLDLGNRIIYSVYGDGTAVEHELAHLVEPDFHL